MIQRSRVQDSRRAATELHSHQVLNVSNHSFTGLNDDEWAMLREALEARGIRASEFIDTKIRETIIDLCLGRKATTTVKKANKPIDELDVESMFRAVEDGDFAAIRRLSLKDCRLLGITGEEGKNLADIAKNDLIRNWFIEEVGLKLSL